jgi:putative flippase GtrA
MAVLSAAVARFRPKAFRYIGVSLLGTIFTQAQLVLYVYGFGWNGAVANIVAVTISTIPGYYLSKYWVWHHQGNSSVAREALPFWILNLAGLVLSTIFALIADHFFEQGWVVNVANIAGFGVLWIAKFFILDEYLFKAEPPLIEI